MTARETRTSLIESAHALRDALRGLRTHLGAETPERFVTAVGQMTRRGEQFCEQFDSPTPPDLRDSVVRHDLRAHLAVVINYSELWQRPVYQATIPDHLERLSSVLSTARESLKLLDATVASVGTEGSPGSQGVRIGSPPAPPSSASVLPYQLSREQGCILVVDDNEENRDHLQQLLEQLGHRVIAVASGQDALDRLAHESFDLVLLDVMMPEMDGFAVLERLKASDLWRHIPVLMVSALDRLDSVVAGIAHGAEDYLTRPFNELLLRARVGACLEKKRLRDREQEHLQQIDQLLHAIFPPEVVAELTQNGEIQPRRHDKVGVCFVDVVGFTSFCDRRARQPEEVVRALEWYVEAFEEVAHAHQVQKIKTIGDAFLMVSGLLRPVEDPVLRLVKCAVELLERIREGPEKWQVRVGIHVGPVVAGTLGKSQYSFDLWGSTVNIAARLESIGRPGTITLSNEAWNDVKDHCQGTQRDAAVRGIGAMTIWEFDSFLRHNRRN